MHFDWFARVRVHDTEAMGFVDRAEDLDFAFVALDSHCRGGGLGVSGVVEVYSHGGCGDAVGVAASGWGGDGEVEEDCGGFVGAVVEAV